MDEKTTALCEGFIENRDIIKKVFRGESIFVYPVAANAITAAGGKADEEKLRLCRKLVRKKSGFFSYIKGNVTTTFAANLSLKEDYPAHFEKVSNYYRIAKRSFTRSDYNVLLAIMLADYVPEDKIESVIERGKTIYDILKNEKRYLTNDQDSVLSGLLALSRKSNNELIEDLEKCYDLLKIKFSSKSSIRMVSHVLAITEGSAREKVEHFIDLYDTLKASKKKFGIGGELVTLAAVSILDPDTDKLCKQILEIDSFLSEQKGYGLLGVDKKARLMHAALLTTDLYDTAQAAMTEGNAESIAMAAAQQLAICVVITTVLDLTGLGSVD